jgi:pimeloyl-ACP methyl ester carboxylesterase
MRPGTCQVRPPESPAQKTFSVLSVMLLRWAPDAILRCPLASDRYIQQIRHATLIFHGLRDTVIPVAQAEALQERTHRAELILLPNVGHRGVQEDATYRNTLLGRLRDL